MRSEARNAINKRFLKAYRILYLDEKVRMKKDFCQKTGVQPQNLSTIERGDLSCTIENIYNLSTNFGVSLNCFFWRGRFLYQRLSTDYHLGSPLQIIHSA